MPHLQHVVMMMMKKMKMEKQPIWKVFISYSYPASNETVGTLTLVILVAVFAEYEESGLLETDEVHGSEGCSV